MNSIRQYFPIAAQLAHYNQQKCINDVIAAVIVTVMLIPQSLAYAMLAGLPPHYGLYASIVPCTRCWVAVRRCRWGRLPLLLS